MRFVEEHLKFHHFKKHPHKWFLAFLVSPIHFAEMHYKRKYHLQFAHARKLFVFDMLLLISSITIFGAGLFWWFYNPTVTDLVYLSIQKTPARVLSGEKLDFSIVYKNESEKKLVSPRLQIKLPDGYVLEKTEPADNFNKNINTFDLNNLQPSDENIVKIFGRIYETPHLETNISASLDYTQEGRQKEEKITTPLITVLHGSVLKSQLTIADRVLSKSNVPFTLQITNEGDAVMNDITIPLSLPQGITIINPESHTGQILSDKWSITKLEANESTNLKAYFNLNIDSAEKTLNLKITPEIFINKKNIPQETVSHTLQILHPNLSISSNWDNNISDIKPGQSTILNLNIKNTGDTTLDNLLFSFPINNNIIDTTKFISTNNINIKNSVATLTKNITLTPGQTTEVSLEIPIKNYPSGGVDLNFLMNPQIEAFIHGVESVYKTSFETPKLKIGTSLFSSAEIIYYTTEGDQLGRGPLPAQVDQETKYWAMLQMTNGTSKINNLRFTATLPSYSVWTGKSSVSQGNDITFDPNTRQVSWSINSLPANTSAGVYFELSITPDSSMLGGNPIMLKNISLTGQDSYINTTLEKYLVNIDNSLKTDSIGRSKGTLIE